MRGTMFLGGAASVAVVTAFGLYIIDIDQVAEARQRAGFVCFIGDI